MMRLHITVKLVNMPLNRVRILIQNFVSAEWIHCTKVVEEISK